MKNPVVVNEHPSQKKVEAVMQKDEVANLAKFARVENFSQPLRNFTDPANFPAIFDFFIFVFFPLFSL